MTPLDPDYLDPDAITVPSRRRRKPTASHYKVICISMYNRDVEDLDAKVAELKKRGLTRMSKSRLIRIALAHLDLDRVVRSEVP